MKLALPPLPPATPGVVEFHPAPPLPSRIPPLKPSGCVAVPGSPLPTKVLTIGIAPARFISGLLRTGPNRPVIAGAVTVAAGPTRVPRVGPGVDPSASHENRRAGALHVDSGWADALGAPINNAAAGAASTRPAP